MRLRDLVPADIGPSEEQLYGIEVEAENYRVMADGAVMNNWRITDDGSLRNNGVEFVTPGAWTMEQCTENVRLLWETMERNSYVASMRTGIHVHVNCLDYTPEQIGGILATYCLLEPVLFRLCGPEREEGIYCVPWYRADEEVEHAADFVIHGRARRLNNSCKYSALYLAPLMRFGTIEFRHAPTFAQASDMMLWLTVIDRLVAYGRDRTATEVIRTFESDGADAWVERVLTTMAPVVRTYCESIFEDIIEAVDCMAVAETLEPIGTEVGRAWALPTLYVQGDGTRGYHAMQRGGGRMYAIPEPPEFYDDEEPDYDDDDGGW